MMNTLTFVTVAVIAEVAVVWVAYSLGVQNGWLKGWEDRSGKGGA